MQGWFLILSVCPLLIILCTSASLSLELVTLAHQQHVSMMCVSLHCDKRSSTVYSPLSTIYCDIFSAVKVFTSVKLPYSLCTQDCQRIEPVHHKLKYLLPHQYKLLKNLDFFHPVYVNSKKALWNSFWLDYWAGSQLHMEIGRMLAVS